MKRRKPTGNERVPPYPTKEEFESLIVDGGPVVYKGGMDRNGIYSIF